MVADPVRCCSSLRSSEYSIGFALAHVGQKAERLVCLRHRADGQAHIKAAVFRCRGLHFPARANDVGVAGGLK